MILNISIYSLIFKKCHNWIYLPHRCWAAQPSPDQCPSAQGVSGTLSPCPVPPDHPPCHRRNPGQAVLPESAKKERREKERVLFRCQITVLKSSKTGKIPYLIQSHHRLTYLIDEGHGIDQQLCIYTILLMQDLHSVGPWLAAWKSVQVHRLKKNSLSLSNNQQTTLPPFATKQTCTKLM